MESKLVPAANIHLHTDAEQNVYPEKFDPRIIRAQEKYLEPVLGRVLYELLCEAFEAEAATPSVVMPDRLDELHTAMVPMLSQWVFFLSLPFLSTSATNRALETAPEAATGPGYNAYAAGVKTEAEDRTNDLRKWLEARRAIYPELPTCPAKRRRTGGIVL
ncbi:hypothetical protein [uncultured Hymenobacter sp.]|uniref:DUF6712 family protein n=1 Tax=uncultured Hymenobacter sp. TaxID=170016 RepID=UPI0035CAB81D